MNTRLDLRQDIINRLNRCTQDRMQCRNNELNLRNDCVHLIYCIRELLPSDLKDKYDRMSWPADPVKHCLQLIDWFGDPRQKLSDTLFDKMLREQEEEEDKEMLKLSQCLVDSILDDDPSPKTDESTS